MYESYLPPRAVEAMVSAVEQDGKFTLVLDPKAFAAVARSLDFTWRLSVLPADVLEEVGKTIEWIATTLDVDIKKLRDEELEYLNKVNEE